MRVPIPPPTHSKRLGLGEGTVLVVQPHILFKELMYEFHYGHMLRLFGEAGIGAKTRLLFTDTDR